MNLLDQTKQFVKMFDDNKKDTVGNISPSITNIRQGNVQTPTENIPKNELF